METSKKQSAQKKIERAIKLFHEGDLDCAITLAAAGENIMPTTDDPQLFQALQPQNAELEINLVINWLKHSVPPETATISEFEALITIARGITKFVAVYHLSCAEFEATQTGRRHAQSFRRPMAGIVPDRQSPTKQQWQAFSTRHLDNARSALDWDFSADATRRSA